MAALDTNVLVRWLTDDDAEQSAAVARVLQSALEQDERLFVPVTVLLETEWVLRSRYRLDKPSVTAALDALLSATELEFQSEPALEQALWSFKQEGSPDFADCMHAALVNQAGHSPLLTFDVRAARLEGAQRLESEPQDK